MNFPSCRFHDDIAVRGFLPHLCMPDRMCFSNKTPSHRIFWCLIVQSSIVPLLLCFSTFTSATRGFEGKAIGSRRVMEESSIEDRRQYNQVAS